MTFTADEGRTPALDEERAPMDGHHIADPWDLPETPKEPEPGAVTTAPKPAKAVLFARRTGTEHHTPVDDGTPTDPALAGDPAGPVPVLTPAEDGAGAEENPEDSADEQAVALYEGEPVAMADETPVEPATPRFDLGLEPTEIGDVDDGPIGETADFGLFLPVADANHEPEYEVAPPDLDDTFVTSNGPGRPDLSAPHLRDPMTIFAVDESAMPGEPPVPGASLVSLVDESGAVEVTDAAPSTGDDDGSGPKTDDPTADTTKGFRLPGLTLFGRNRTVEVDPTGDASLDPGSVDVAAEVDTVSAIASGAEAGTDADTAPREPVVWSTMSTIAAEPEGGPPNPFRKASVTTPEDGGTTDQVGTMDDPTATEPADTSAPPAGPENGGGVGDVDAPPTAGASGDALDPWADRPHDEPKAVWAILSADPTDHEVTVTEDEPAWLVAEEDAMEIELTDPDLSELTDIEQMYVTEELLAGNVRTALLTVDSVPGSTIARALDVVTAIASAPSADDIAGAMDRAMEQLRDKATQLGGRAVISVRSEVQEIGGGFLVTASGTAVELD